jgi:hypothetical protein
VGHDRVGGGQDVLIAPHQSYVLELKSVANEDGVGAAHPTGWRFLVRRGPEFIGVGETSEAMSGEASRFSKLEPAPEARSVARALRLVETAATDLRDDFEVRYLRIPALYTTTIWLHGSSTDFVMPIDAKKPDLTDAKQFLHELAERARQRLDTDDKTIGG